MEGMGSKEKGKTIGQNDMVSTNTNQSSNQFVLNDNVV